MVTEPLSLSTMQAQSPAVAASTAGWAVEHAATMRKISQLVSQSRSMPSSCKEPQPCHTIVYLFSWKSTLILCMARQLPIQTRWNRNRRLRQGPAGRVKRVVSFKSAGPANVQAKSSWRGVARRAWCGWWNSQRIRRDFCASGSAKRAHEQQHDPCSRTEQQSSKKKCIVATYRNSSGVAHQLDATPINKNRLSTTERNREEKPSKS